MFHLPQIFIPSVHLYYLATPSCQQAKCVDKILPPKRGTITKSCLSNSALNLVCVAGFVSRAEPIMFETRNMFLKFFLSFPYGLHVLFIWPKFVFLFILFI